MDRRALLPLVLACACAFPRSGPVAPDPAQGMIDGQAPHLMALRASDRRIVYGPRPPRFRPAPLPPPDAGAGPSPREVVLVTASIVAELLGTWLAREFAASEPDESTLRHVHQPVRRRGKKR
jgi:hypothetical protein